MTPAQKIAHWEELDAELYRLERDFGFIVYGVQQHPVGFPFLGHVNNPGSFSEFVWGPG